ncbi:Arylsulfotransferase ASST OS=Streptomyces fumanus OX=67302 GN=GCM10018772_35860 PE=4 SV=1 [Streptomyces fumanus]
MTHRLRTLTAIAATTALAFVSNASGTAPDARAAATADPVPELRPGDLATTPGTTEPPAANILVRRPGRAHGDMSSPPRA